MSIEILKYPYQCDLAELPSEFLLGDHIMGFSADLENNIFERINGYASQHSKCYSILTDQYYPAEIHSKYPKLNIKFNMDVFNRFSQINSLQNYTKHPEINYKNFICSFNGTEHIGRKLLVAILDRFGYFDPTYCSKNIVFTQDVLDGHIADLVGDQESFYRKFFIGNSSKEFFDTIYTFDYVRVDHANNIYNLENKLTQSFLHIVSETVSTSYYPYVTEKFLYSVVTRGLFLTYGQPGWYEYLEKYFGFKRYDKIFDYEFDQVKNPVKRLMRLMETVSKFSKLSIDDWRDLYMIERDTIEYNYNHYFSRDYLKTLQKQI